MRSSQWTGDSVWSRISSMVSLYMIAICTILRELTGKLFGKIRKQQEFQRRSGDVAVLTGGTGGIGGRLLSRLLQCDMRVILGVRRPSEAMKVVEKIRQEGVTSGTVEYFPLDLASLESTRQFALTVMQICPTINYVIHCAGVLFATEETADGLEPHLQINYLSNFLLTHLLLPRLKSTGIPARKARVIFLSSSAHASCRITDDFELLRDIKSPHLYYAHSKLMMVMSAIYINQKMREENQHVRCLAIHPGVVGTELYNNAVFWVRLLRFILMTPQDGADIVMYAVLSPHLDEAEGEYMESCGIKKPSKTALDESSQINVFDKSCKVTGITDFGQEMYYISRL